MRGPASQTSAISEFICKNLDNPIGSPQIANVLGCRRADLDRLFHVQLGHSVGEEIRRRRFAQVKLLIETTDWSISSIARQMGYCTPAHLTNAFKKAFGLTPKAWRKNRGTLWWGQRVTP